MTVLPENVDATYPDRGEGDAAHQQHHDALHGETHNALQAIPDGQVAGKVGGLIVGVNAGDSVVPDPTGQAAGLAPLTDGVGAYALTDVITQAEGDAAIVNHEAEADPHAQYLTQTDGDGLYRALATPVPQADVDGLTASLDGKVGSATVDLIVVLTQAEYDALTPDPETLYIIES